MLVLPPELSVTRDAGRNIEKVDFEDDSGAESYPQQSQHHKRIAIHSNSQSGVRKSIDSDLCRSNTNFPHSVSRIGGAAKFPRSSIIPTPAFRSLSGQNDEGGIPEITDAP